MAKSRYAWFTEPRFRKHTANAKRIRGRLLSGLDVSS